jgi:hypothetical protein
VIRADIILLNPHEIALPIWAFCGDFGHLSQNEAGRALGRFPGIRRCS